MWLGFFPGKGDLSSPQVGGDRAWDLGARMLGLGWGPPWCFLPLNAHSVWVPDSVGSFLLKTILFLPLPFCDGCFLSSADLAYLAVTCPCFVSRPLSMSSHYPTVC